MRLLQMLIRIFSLQRSPSNHAPWLFDIPLGALWAQILKLARYKVLWHEVTDLCSTAVVLWHDGLLRLECIR